MCQFYIAILILITEELHSKYIIYRDFKPENIMVDETVFFILFIKLSY